MTNGPIDVFISYKREDEARVERLVRALETSGLRVWWDRHLPGAANWRQQLESHLAKARCVLVVWSNLSVTEKGEFVHDEASRALERLVPVHIDRVRPPLGFGERQSLDLVGWKGGAEDLRFIDVVSAVRAIVKGEPLPMPRWPRVRRLRIGGFSTIASVASLALAVVLNLGSLQDLVCRIGVVRDFCGEHGWGGVPSRAEQAAFDEALTVEDDSGYRSFLARFPTGVLADEAQRRLSACRPVDRQAWRALPAQSVPYTYRATKESDDAEAGKKSALEAANLEARVFCGQTETLRVTSFRFEQVAWRHCDPTDGRVACDFDAMLVCEREILETTTHLSCRK